MEEEQQHNGRMGQLSAAAPAIILYVFSAGMLSCVCFCVCVRALRATMASGLHDPRRSKKQAEREKERKKQTNLAEIALRNHLAKMCTGVREGERESGKGRAREEEGGSSSCCVLI